MSKTILYLECATGISGDMTVAALLDLGASKVKLLAALDSLNVDGYSVTITRARSFFRASAHPLPTSPYPQTTACLPAIRMSSARLSPSVRE